MTACRVKTALLAVVAAALCAAPLAPARAQADAGAPVKLAPPKGGPKPGLQPAPPPGPPRAGPPAAGPVYVPPTTVEPSVEVNPLQAPDPESGGVLDADNGGFGANMWDGMSRDLVMRLLPSLPVKAPSPAMRDAMRRLLLSVAGAPAGERTGESLTALRARMLAEMGDAKGMSQLLDAVSPKGSDEALARTRVNGLLLSGDTTAACDQVDQQIRQYTNEYWQQAFVFCQAESGKREQARLSLALLRESAADKNQTFFQVASVLVGDSTKEVATTADVSPLVLAMLKSANQPIPADVAKAADPPVLMSIAGNAAADWAVRLSAAEQATAMGLMQPETLANLYSQVDFSPEQIDNALSSARNEGGPKGRALLYQAAARQNVPAARAEVLQEALDMARGDGVFATTARVNAPLLQDVQPAAELMWLAADAGQALFVANDCGAGTGWYELAANGAQDAEQIKAEAALWPLAILCDPNTHIASDPPTVRKWLAAAKESGGENWRKRAGIMLGLLNAAGKFLDFADWQDVVEPASAEGLIPDVALWNALRDSADANRIGGTVLFALLAIGNDGPQKANPVVVNAAVSGLDAVGLNGVGRRLAIEAAVAVP